MVVLLEAQDQLRTMGEQLLLQGSEGRTFSRSYPMDPQTLHHLHACLLSWSCHSQSRNRLYLCVRVSLRVERLT